MKNVKVTNVLKKKVQTANVKSGVARPKAVLTTQKQTNLNFYPQSNKGKIQNGQIPYYTLPNVVFPNQFGTMFPMMFNQQNVNGKNFGVNNQGVRMKSNTSGVKNFHAQKKIPNSKNFVGKGFVPIVQRNVPNPSKNFPQNGKNFIGNNGRFMNQYVAVQQQKQQKGKNFVPNFHTHQKNKPGMKLSLNGTVAPRVIIPPGIKLTTKNPAKIVKKSMVKNPKIVSKGVNRNVIVKTNNVNKKNQFLGKNNVQQYKGPNTKNLPVPMPIFANYPRLFTGTGMPIPMPMNLPIQVPTSSNGKKSNVESVKNGKKTTNPLPVTNTFPFPMGGNMPIFYGNFFPNYVNMMNSRVNVNVNLPPLMINNVGGIQNVNLGQNVSQQPKVRNNVTRNVKVTNTQNGYGRKITRTRSKRKKSRVKKKSVGKSKSCSKNKQTKYQPPKPIVPRKKEKQEVVLNFVDDVLEEGYIDSYLGLKDGTSKMDDIRPISEELDFLSEEQSEEAFGRKSSNSKPNPKLDLEYLYKNDDEIDYHDTFSSDYDHEKLNHLYSNGGKGKRDREEDILDRDREKKRQKISSTSGPLRIRTRGLRKKKRTKFNINDPALFEERRKDHDEIFSLDYNISYESKTPMSPILS